MDCYIFFGASVILQSSDHLVQFFLRVYNDLKCYSFRRNKIWSLDSLKYNLRQYIFRLLLLFSNINSIAFSPVPQTIQLPLVPKR